MKKIIFTLCCFCAVTPAWAQIDVFADIGMTAKTAEAVSRYQSGLLIEYVAACAMEAQTKINFSKDTCGNLMPYSEAPFGLDGKKFTVSNIKGSSGLLITTPDIESEAVRKDLLSQNHSIMTTKAAGKKIKFTIKR